MAFIGTQNLIKLQDRLDIISPFHKGRIKYGAYELSLGDQVFLTDSKPRSTKSLSQGEKIHIEPGQFALLLTEETIKVPRDKIAFISIKGSIKFKGLVNVSGFHVDPGFNGKLLFSVHNAGPATIVLSRGSAYFPIWFADMDESQNYNGKHNNQINIPDNAIEPLSQGEIASPIVLGKRIEETNNTLGTRIELANHHIRRLELALSIIITLAGALLVKFYTDNSKLKEAVDYGYQKKNEEIITDSTYIKMKSDINLLTTDVDTLKKVIKH